MPAEVTADLKFYLGKKKKGHIFPARKVRGVGIHPIQINKIVAAAGRQARIKNPNPQLKNINPHSLRHSYARQLKDRGVSIEAIQNLLGHKSFKMTMDTYGLMSIDDIDKELNDKVFV